MNFLQSTVNKLHRNQVMAVFFAKYKNCNNLHFYLFIFVCLNEVKSAVCKKTAGHRKISGGVRYFSGSLELHGKHVWKVLS